MAGIKNINVIKGISGKYGSGTNDYFATNEQYEPRRGDHWRSRQQ